MSAKDVIIALDFPTREETLSFLDQFPAGEKPFVKIGMELFYAEGPQVVRGHQGPGPQDLPGPEAPRHPQHREAGHGGPLPTGCGYGEPPRRRDL